MDLATLKTLNRLLEQALDLPVRSRITWVDELGAEYDAFKPRLREMLQHLEATGDAGLFETLPKWQPPVTSPAHGVIAGAHEGQMVGPYRLMREIAAGGQGAVWLAERADGLIDRRVAVKLPVGLGWRPGLGERLSRERDLLARLAHPNIARLYDAGLSEVGPYIALEYVDGLPIDQHVRHHRLDVRATLGLALQVVDAVAHAHGQLVIHRDIKPSNVLVTEGGHVRLLDFGIAKLLDGDDTPRDSTMTMAAGRALTLAYASPEQVVHEALGVGTDVYSLGVLIYELLCGRRPYAPARESMGALEDAILHGEPTRPSVAATDPGRARLLRGDLDAVLLKALRKRPDERYPTAAAFGDDLRAWLGGLPVTARPDRAAYRARKFVGRHRLAVAAAAAVLTAIVGGAGVALWQARAARLERDRADAVKSFVVSMFRDVDPNLRGAGRPLSAVDVLAIAQERLGRLPETDAEVRIELQRVLGESFLGVGDPGRAAEVLSQVLPGVVAKQGRESDAALDIELRLALADQLLGKSDAASARLTTVRETLARTGRLESATFVDLAILQTEILLTRGGAARPETEAAAREAVAAATRILGPRHARRAKALQMLATVTRSKSLHAEALTHSEGAYRLMRDLTGDDARDAAVISAQNEYGRALFQAGRTREAITQLQEAATHGVETFRNNPVIQQHLLGTLANVQLSYGAVKDAVANLERAEAADLRDVKLSESYLASQDVVRGRALMAAWRPADAIEKFDRALAVYRRIGETNLGAMIQSERVEALVRLGRLAEAERDLPALTAARTPPMTPTTRRGVWLLGEVARLRGRRDIAIPLFREAADDTPASGRSRLNKAAVQLSLGLALLDGGDVSGAGEALEAARQTYASDQGVLTPAHAQVLTALGRVHLARGQATEAARLLVEASTFWRAFAPGDPETTRVATLLDTARRSSASPLP